MTYYLIIYVDKEWKDAPPEYFWTKNSVHVDLFFEEYSHAKDHSAVYAYEDCKNDFDFFNLVLVTHNINISDINELYLMTSDHDPSVFHITTPRIQDDLIEGGMTDAQYESTINNIIKSSMNILLMSNFVKDESFSEYAKETMLKYVSKFVLMDSGVISDNIHQGNVNIHALKYMGIDHTSSSDYEEGIFSAVDYVMFSKMSEGIEP